jgi:hypothetical protein
MVETIESAISDDNVITLVHTHESEYDASTRERVPEEATTGQDALLDDDTEAPVENPFAQIDDILDGTLPIEKFIIDLEERMRLGHSYMSNAKWARVRGIDSKSFRQYVDVIRGTWRLEGATVFATHQKRDEYRQMYRVIFADSAQYARETGCPKNRAIALKAVDAMAKLDGLMAPDVTVNVDARGADARGYAGSLQNLTNKTRERTQQLLMMMRERAEKHAEKTQRALTTIATRAAETQPMDREAPTPVSTVAEVENGGAVVEVIGQRINRG